MQKAHIDVLNAVDSSFHREKAQALCLYPDLDLSEMDFFKVVINAHLVYMEEVKPSPTNDPIQEYRAAVSNLEDEGEDKDEE